MRVKREDSMVWYVMHMAAKPAGITHPDLPERFHKQRQNLSNSMMKLVVKGLVNSTREGRCVRYTCTAEQLARYVANGYHIQSPKMRSKLPVGAQRMVANWDKDEPAHLPYDADGKPLFKLTIAPPPPVMFKTNTHSML
jgi:hypothetical protein